MPIIWNALWPWWRVAGGFAPFPLLSAPSLTDIREWEIEVIPATFVPNRPFPNNGQLHVPLHRILIEAGIALTPATTSWDPRSWFPLYRYGADFLGTAPRLRFYSGVLEKDPRHTAIASEEVATGITCYILREHFALAHIADAYACIQRGELSYVNPPSESRPDYYCQDANHESVIAESKGATGTRSDITGRINSEGWAQVQNVAPTNLPLRKACSRIVVGTHFCVDSIHPRSETTTIVKDPDGSPGTGRDPNSDVVVRLAYAKSLRFIGQEILADRLLIGGALSNLRSMFLADQLSEIGPLPMVPLGLSPFGDLVGVFRPTFDALFSGESSISGRVSESLGAFRERRHELGRLGYGLPNGLILLRDVPSQPSSNQSPRAGG